MFSLTIKYSHTDKVTGSETVCDCECDLKTGKCVRQALSYKKNKTLLERFQLASVPVLYLFHLFHEDNIPFDWPSTD